MRRTVQRKPLDSFKAVLRKIVLALMAVLVAFPLLYLFSSSLFSPGDFGKLRVFPSAVRWSNYAKVFALGDFRRQIINSVGTAVLASAIRTAVIVLAAFALTHLHFRGKGLALSFLVMTLFIPQDAVLYQNYRTVAALGLLDSWAGIICTSLFSAAQMLLLTGSFSAIGREPYDAARIDGASDLRYIRSVLVPLCTPAVLTVIIQTLITVFNSYLWPLLVTNRPTTRTIQTGLTMLGFAESGETGAQMAAIAVMTLPFLILLAFAKKKIENALIRK